jgi:hypothetical protein
MYFLSLLYFTLLAPIIYVLIKRKNKFMIFATHKLKFLTQFSWYQTSILWTCVPYIYLKIKLLLTLLNKFRTLRAPVFFFQIFNSGFPNMFFKTSASESLSERKYFLLSLNACTVCFKNLLSSFKKLTKKFNYRCLNPQLSKYLLNPKRNSRSVCLSVTKKFYPNG